MDQSQKIDAIFAKVSKIETNVAVIMERDATTEKRINSHEGKLEAINEVIIAYKIERAKIVGIAVASGAIFSAIGVATIWITNLFSKNN